MTPPAIRAEAAHAARRDGRAALAQEEWPFRDHRTQADVMRAELAEAARRAGERVNEAYERSTTP